MASSNRRFLDASPPIPETPPPPADDDYCKSCEHYSPPPPPPPSHRPTNPIVLRCKIAGIVIGGALVFTVMYMVIARYFLKRNPSRLNSRRRNHRDEPPILFNTQADFVDEEQGPHLDHPIWYIRTIGLDRSIIESIAVFKYKTGEGLIEGTECSVCLGEFMDDDALRLLPKCSHAFHVPCIDTWLQSHKNCPLCRAPIVRSDGTDQPSHSSPNLMPVEENPRNRPNRAVSVSSSGLSLSPIGELGASENGVEDNDTFGSDSSRIEEGGTGKVRPLPDLRVLSDLGDHRRVVAGGEELVQPMRRSVSMDSPSASKIYQAVAAISICDRIHDNSKKQAVKMNTRSCSSSSRNGSGSSGLFKMVKSCSFGGSLDMEPRSMRRSSSVSSSRNAPSIGQ